MRICVTGATGFIGKNLLKHLKGRSDYEIIALSRKITDQLDGAKKDNTIWRSCNGFSMIEAEKVTKDVDVLIYLIHSMIPPVSLSQGSFRDYDLYLADNFARACAKNGVKKIIYISGLIPDNLERSELSEHLKSRSEIESTLGQYGTSVTTLRAGLIVGKEGSSFKILERLVNRLPLFLCPKWTNSKCQTIDLSDVLISLDYCFDHIDNLEDVYDIGGPEILTYKNMLLKTAEVMGKKRKAISVPFLSPMLSRFWVSQITGCDTHLVYPLVESLKHDMVVRKDHQLLIENHQYKSFSQSIADSRASYDEGWIWRITDFKLDINIPVLKNVSSLQRMFASKKMSALEVSNLYFSWLPKFFKPFILVERKDHDVFFKGLGIKLLHLRKSDKRGDDNRVVYYVVSGFLASRKSFNGRLEFRWMPAQNCFLIALLDFRPALPWIFYKFTQAIIHLFVMNKFHQYLKSRK